MESRKILSNMQKRLDGLKKKHAENTQRMDKGKKGTVITLKKDNTTTRRIKENKNSALVDKEDIPSKTPIASTNKSDSQQTSLAKKEDEAPTQSSLKTDSNETSSNNDTHVLWGGRTPSIIIRSDKKTGKTTIAIM